MRAISKPNITPLVGKYVMDALGTHFDEGLYTAFGIFDDEDNIKGGVVISEYRGHDCMISCVVDTPVAWRDNVILDIFSYIFVTANCIRCTCVTTKNNKPTRKFLEHLGFQLEGRLRQGYDGIKDALIYGLLREECRFLEPLNDGQKHAETPASTGPGSDSERPSGGEPGNGDSAGEPQSN